MIVYKCKISGDEMGSDVFKTISTYNDTILELEGKIVDVRADNDFVLEGANPSAEEEQEAMDAGPSERKFNVVHYSKLVETRFAKKDFLTYLKGYMKRIENLLKEQNPDRVEDFKKNAQTAVKDIIKDFKNYEFFTGESMNPDGMVGLVNFREDGITPYLILFKDGLEMEKQ